MFTQNLKSSLFAITLGFCTFSASIPGLLAAPSDATLSAQQYRAELLLNLGNRQLTNGQLSAALSSLQESLIIYRELGDRLGEANALLRLGETNFTLGRYRQAIDFYQQSWELMSALGEQKGELQILEHLSNSYFHIGNEKLAQEFKERAVALRKEIGNPPREASFLSNVGVNHEGDGEYQKAIEFYAEELTIGLETRDRLLQVDALRNLGGVYRQLGQYPQAIVFFQQQLTLARKLGDTVGERLILQQLAQAYTNQGDFPQAIAFYQQQLELAKKSPDSGNQNYLIKQLGRAYIFSGQSAAALALFQEQLTTAKAARDTLNQGMALNNLAFTYLKTGKFVEAKSTLTENIGVWQKHRENLGNTGDYAGEQANTYLLLQQVLIAQKQPESALEAAEAGSTMAFLNLLGRRLVTESVGTGLAVAPQKIVPPTISEIQAIAKAQKATLVKYAIVPDEGIYTWVIQSNGKVTFRLINPQKENTISPISSVAELVASIPVALGVKTKGIKPQKDAKPLLQLNQLLIKPIADLLPKSPDERVIFIPEDELLLVPFPALVDIYGKYLIEKHPISIIPAIQVLQLAKQQRGRTGGSKVVVVGNPIMPKIAQTIGAAPQQLPPLVNGEKEALEIADFFKTKPLVGNQATKAAILALLPKAKRIHFATYGILDDINRKGIPGAIALSAAGDDDGLLTASDILNLYTQPKGKRLRASLIVLSAGESGSGSTGKGVVGLSLALMSAGVPSIVVSQWTVPDAPTDKLMQEFYRQLQRNPDKAQALRNAILATMKEFPNPKYWGGLSLIGEAR
jgi:CHAT domain-containing protein